MESYDVAVIGGGLLGCFAARNLMRWKLSAVLVERAADVCTGISRANTAIIYPGYDHKPGTLKSELTVKANASFDRLCEELDVRFSRCGSMMLSFGENGDKVLRKKLENGIASGVPGLRLLSGEEARTLEPTLSDQVRSALFSPTAGTVDPWELGIAACENAVKNGCTLRLHTVVEKLGRKSGGYMLTTDRGEIFCRAVINCAGLESDRVSEMLFPPKIRIVPSGADYMVLDRSCAKLRHIVEYEPEDGGKGLSTIPTVDGSLLLGPSERDCEAADFSTERRGLEFVRKRCREVFPTMDLSGVIRSFAAVRPNPVEVICSGGAYVETEKSFSSFAVEESAPGFISLIGVKTPGLTCANELGLLCAEKTAAYLHAAENSGFDPKRNAIPRTREMDEEALRCLIAENSDYADIVCRCERVSRGEIVESVRRGAVTPEGVKRRTGAMMGHCQGGQCERKIVDIIAETLRIAPDAVLSDRGEPFVHGGGDGES